MTDRNPLELARLAGVNLLGGNGSEGARWLTGIAVELEDEIGDDAYPWSSEQIKGVIQGISDECAPPYLAQRWQVFVDLSGWSVDLSDYVADYDVDMSVVAAAALSRIAEKLMRALYKADHSAAEAAP